MAAACVVGSVARAHRDAVLRVAADGGEQLAVGREGEAAHAAAQRAAQRGQDDPVGGIPHVNPRRRAELAGGNQATGGVHHQGGDGVGVALAARAAAA